MTDLYAVIGHPIKHSKSPWIHSEFAKLTDQDLRYDALLGEPGQFSATVRDFFGRGGRGLNVTLPFKLDAFEFADMLTERAEHAGAVNTLALQSDGRVLGDNTDGIGFVTDLTRNQGISVEGRRVLVLGAGGAVRGILWPLLNASPASVLIANRTASKAEALADTLAQKWEVQGGGFDALRDAQFDVIINGSSAGITGDLPPLPDTLLAPGGSAYDLVYGNTPPPFVRWANDHGAIHAADGLGMLVEQAAESFALWRGVRPPTAGVIEQLRSGLQAN